MSTEQRTGDIFLLQNRGRDSALRCPRTPQRGVPTDLLHAQQLIGERACIINFAQSFDDRGGIDRDGARLFVGENAVEDERLNVAVENDSHEFAGLVHDRTAAVTADNVSIGDKIEMRR